MDFVPFKKIPRLSRECVITEKIDGTNAQVNIFRLHDHGVIPDDVRLLDYWYEDDGTMFGAFAGSRNRWLTATEDNAGFFKWAKENIASLKELGPGAHFGEWWGQKIGRHYDLKDRRFSLFNVAKWGESRPECCHVVPVLWRGMFDTTMVEYAMETLSRKGSVAAPGFMEPEGVIVYHVASGHLYKKTCEKDESPKGAPV